VRDEALSELSGVPGCVFVHSSGFIGGNSTYEGALAMAMVALDFPPTDSSP
jgi:MYG1 exonuclease